MPVAHYTTLVRWLGAICTLKRHSRRIFRTYLPVGAPLPATITNWTRSCTLSGDRRHNWGGTGQTERFIHSLADCAN